MVSQIVGNYLVELGIITRGQLLVLNKERQKLRAKLGLIAVSEGYMTSMEVKAIYDEIPEDEPSRERAFADAAEELGYLTKSQIRSLAYKQNDSYLCLVEAMEKHNIIDIESLEDILRKFPLTKNEVQIDDLKSNDVNRIIPLFLPPEAEDYIDAASSAMRFLNHKVDENIYPLHAFVTDKFSASNGVIQIAKGEKEYAYAIVAKNEELAIVSTCYMRERYDGIDEEILDIVGEIVNKMSSSYATELSQDGVLIDLMPPQTYLTMNEIITGGMLVLTLTVKNETFYLLICMSNVIEIR